MIYQNTKIFQSFSKRFVSIGLVVLYFQCSTTPPKQTEPKPKPSSSSEANSTPSSQIENPVSIRPIPFSSRWTEDLYYRFTPASFRNYPPANQTIQYDSIDLPLLNAAIFFVTNAKRKDAGISHLLHSPALEKASFDHSQAMVELNFFSHFSPVVGRKSPSDRMDEIGIQNAYKAENIAMGYILRYQSGEAIYTPDQTGGYFAYDLNGSSIPNHTYLSLADSLVDSWMESPGHKRNLLDPKMIYLGVGSKNYKDESFFQIEKVKVTQKFSNLPGSLVPTP